MTGTKRFLVAVMILVIIEFSYFISITSIVTVTGMRFHAISGLVMGVVIAISYTIIIDNWLRNYRDRINYRISSIENTQKKLSRRIDRLESQINNK